MAMSAVVFFLCVGVAVAAAGNGKSANKAYPAFKYSETGTEPVVEYNLVHHMLAEQSQQPLLRIYGNGRVHVHYPAYMTRAGDYELQLSQAELRSLLRGMATDGILDFDPVATRQQRQQLVAQQRASNATLFHLSDSSDTVINVRLDEYQAGPASAPIVNLRKQFIWPDLKHDARRFPGLPGIARANDAAHRLDALLQRDDLARSR